MIKKRIGAILRRFVTNTDWYKKQFLDCDKFWQNKHFGNEEAFIGSDSGHYAYSNLNSTRQRIDLTLRDSTILQIYEVLRNYSSFLKENQCNVFMIISPFDFLTGSTTYFEDRYYSIINMASIPGFAYERRAEVMARRNNPLIYYPLFCLKKDLFAKRRSNNSSKLTATQYVEHIKHRYGIRDFRQNLSMINKDSFNDSLSILYKIQSFCDDHGYSFTLVFPPVTTVFAKYLKEYTENESYIRLIDQISNSGIRIKDYSYDEKYANNSEYFISELYLNEKGAKVFINELLS